MYPRVVASESGGACSSRVTASQSSRRKIRDKDRYAVVHSNKDRQAGILETDGLSERSRDLIHEDRASGQRPAWTVDTLQQLGVVLVTLLQMCGTLFISRTH